MEIVGILLAAGRGQRFDPSGSRQKLMAALPDGRIVAEASARAMRSALPRVLAVTGGEGTLATLLRQQGCDVTLCPDAASGMAASLTHALRHSLPGADGWIIALADMPHVQASTIAALAAALAAGAHIAVPVFEGRRGNPVAFSSLHLQELLALSGDQGARALLQRHRVQAVDTHDPGILLDIDQPADLDTPAAHEKKPG